MYNLYNNPTYGSTTGGSKGFDDTYVNINLLEPPFEEYSAFPTHITVWRGKFPYKHGDPFPTPFLEHRMRTIYTNRMIYEGKHFQDIFQTAFSVQEFMSDALTKLPILRIIPNLPDYKMLTDTWVQLEADALPNVDGRDRKKVSALSSLITNSNYGTSMQRAVQESIVKDGNSIFRADQMKGGRSKAVPMSVGNWEPYVSPSDTSTIEVNSFFNIYAISHNEYVCEFILYHEDGKVEKYIFSYDKGTKRLGRLLEHKESKAFRGKGVSPIVVFKGPGSGDSPFGNPVYHEWEAAMLTLMKTYYLVILLAQRKEEYYRVIPKGALTRDDASGMSYFENHGVLAYDPGEDKKSPDVKLLSPEVKLDEAIAAYNEALISVSRYTILPYFIFDTKNMTSEVSGKAMEKMMFRTNKKVQSDSLYLDGPAKELAIKMALASGIELDAADFSLTFQRGFTDKDSMIENLLKRVGDVPTIHPVEAISRIDGISLAEAESRWSVIQGETPKDDNPEISVTEAGDGSEVSDISLTVPDSGVESTDPTKPEPKKPVQFYPLDPTGGGL